MEPAGAEAWHREPLTFGEEGCSDSTLYLWRHPTHPFYVRAERVRSREDKEEVTTKSPTQRFVRVPTVVRCRPSRARGRCLEHSRHSALERSA
eukprot:6727004-Pyramimonas_sp.AAC.1